MATTRRTAHQLAQLAEPDPYTLADAQLDVAAGAQEQLAKEIRDQRERVERARASLAKARKEFDRIVARAISSDPRQVAWYDHPGVLSRRRVATEAKLTPVQLARLMERYRDAQGVPKRKTRRPH